MARICARRAESFEAQFDYYCNASLIITQVCEGGANSLHGLGTTRVAVPVM